MKVIKNCFTCKLLNIGTTDRLCEYYPKELSTAPDIIGGFYCEHYDQVKIKYIEHSKELKNKKQMHPFIISLLNTDMINPEEIKELEKLKRSIKRNERLLDWIFGFFVGISFGLVLLIITIKL